MLSRRCLKDVQRLVFRICHRKLETSSNAQTTYDLFRQTENSHTYDYLKTLPEYSHTFFDTVPLQSPDKWKEFKPCVQEFKDKLASAGQDTYVTDYEPAMVTSIIQEKSSLSDDELRAVLYALRLPPKTPKPKAVSFQMLWMGLDEECMKRLSGWNQNAKLCLTDLWFKIHLARLSECHWNVVKRLFRNADKLNKIEFVRFMFCLNLCRQLPDAMSTYELEHNLIRLEPEMSPEEVCISAMAFFKCETRIRDVPLMNRLVEKVQSKANDLDSIFVAAFFKFMRLSVRTNTSTLVYHLQDRFVPEISRLSVGACNQLAIMGAQAQVYHKKLLQLILEKFEANIELARLKEIERILLTMTAFDVNCDSLCHKVITLLRSPDREREIHNYGRSLPAIVYYISLRQIYPYDLISKVLSTEFLQEYYGKNMQRYQREILCLDYTVELECPDYTGNRLTTKVKNSVSKFNLFWLWPPSKEKVSNQENNIRMISRGLKEVLGGENFVHACNILPQFGSAELVFCLDEKNRPVEVPEKFREIPDFIMKPVPEDLKSSIKFHAVLACNPNFFAANDPRLIMGQNQLLIRQLQKIGYTVHLVLPQETNALRNTFSVTEAKEFYSQLLFKTESAPETETRKIQSQSISAEAS